jgi:hypothetical protein
MPWKIVNLDYACDRPHLHIKDPNAPIHLRAYFEGKQVEVGLGADDPDECFVRAFVSSEAVDVKAVRFERNHLNILISILASLDVEPDERDRALAWMGERMALGSIDRDGMFEGNIDAFPPPSGWPYDLTDEALRDSLRDIEGTPSTRRKALAREARRRGMRAPGVDRNPTSPEIFRKRGPVRGG